MFEHLQPETIERFNTVEVNEPESDREIEKDSMNWVSDTEHINTWKMSELFFATMRLQRSPLLKHSGRIPENRQIIYIDSLSEFCNK